LSKIRFASICIRTKELDFSDLSNPKYDWTYTIYGKVNGLLPKDAPEPLGKCITILHYVDANLMHDINCEEKKAWVIFPKSKVPRGRKIRGTHWVYYPEKDDGT
jgi:hypothetical protein